MGVRNGSLVAFSLSYISHVAEGKALPFRRSKPPKCQNEYASLRTVALSEFRCHPEQPLCLGLSWVGCRLYQWHCSMTIGFSFPVALLCSTQNSNFLS